MSTGQDDPREGGSRKGMHTVYLCFEIGAESLYDNSLLPAMKSAASGRKTTYYMRGKMGRGGESSRDLRQNLERGAIENLDRSDRARLGASTWTVAQGEIY